MKKHFILFYAIFFEAMIIISISAATMFSGIIFSLFYNVLYGLLISTILPIVLIMKYRENFSSVGINKFGIKQLLVVLFFVLFSIGGQVIPMVIKGEMIDTGLLPICVLPLIMTTFFEEFLFRGFMQTRFEKAYGSVIAVLLSGLMFSLYHLGYPGFRKIGDLALLFAVGIGFALAFKLSGNNVIASYFVNLPNAVLTYILKSKQFPVFRIDSSMYAVISIIVIICIFYQSSKKMKKP